MNVNRRIEGLDLARALAVYGMVVVNFKLVMGSETGSALLRRLAGLVEGRAVATFVVLAGVGVTLLSRRARESADAIMVRQTRYRILRRAALLFLVGLSYASVWPADILHFYGVYFVAAAFLFTASNRALWAASAIFIGVFLVLLTVLDYTTGWNFDTLEYAGFWTPDGMVRHLFFNGFHPVFPWAAFLFLGMWLGRLDLQDGALRRRVMAWAAGIWLVTEGLSKFLVSYGLRAWPDVPVEDVRALLGTSPMPPMPQYLLAGGSLALVVILLCLEASERWGDAPVLQALVSTGKLSLTLYVAHVLVGMGTLEAMGWLENQPIERALISTLMFCLAGTAFAVLWLRRFRSGPLEWVFRRLAG